MKRIRYNKWEIEKPKRGFGFHLYKDVEVESKVKGVKTGEFKIVSKLQGYNLSLDFIIKHITEECVYNDSKTLTDLLKSINNKVENTKIHILEQIIHNLK